MGSTRQSSIQQGRCHTETCSVRVNLDFPLWHPSWNQLKIRSQKCGKKYSKINTQNLNIQIQKCSLRTKHNGSFPGQNIPDDALEKIFLIKKFATVQWTLWCYGKTALPAKILIRSRQKCNTVSSDNVGNAVAISPLAGWWSMQLKTKHH